VQIHPSSERSLTKPSLESFQAIFFGHCDSDEIDLVYMTPQLRAQIPLTQLLPTLQKVPLDPHLNLLELFFFSPQLFFFQESGLLSHVGRGNARRAVKGDKREMSEALKVHRGFRLTVRSRQHEKAFRYGNSHTYSRVKHLASARPSPHTNPKPTSGHTQTHKKS
jgi:hypothetical protein